MIDIQIARPRLLERANFRIDSSAWKTGIFDDGTRVKINPEGDVTELLEGEFAGQQYFSLPAAIRETAKVGKRMPTKEKWAAIMLSVNPSLEPEYGWQDDCSVRETLGLELAGFRANGYLGFPAMGKYGFYWALSPSKEYGYGITVSATRLTVASHNFFAYGLSVRCLP
jgi:hypothetical protein